MVVEPSKVLFPVEVTILQQEYITLLYTGDCSIPPKNTTQDGIEIGWEMWGDWAACY